MRQAHFVVLVYVFCCIACGNTAWSQPPVDTDQSDSSRTLSIGAFGSLNVNVHRANFDALPNVPTGREGDGVRFGNASSVGFSVGLFAEYPLNESVLLGLRASYGTHNSVLRATEHQRIGLAAPDGSQLNFYDAVFGRELSVSLAMLALEPIVTVHPFQSTAAASALEHLRLYAGARVSIPFLQTTYRQEERILSPTRSEVPLAVFNTLSEYRNQQPPGGGAAALPVVPFGLGAVVGVGYDIPIGGVRITPEVFYTLGLTSLVEGVTWNLDIIRAGLAVRYVLPPLPPPPPAPPVAAITASVSAFSVDTSGAEVPLVQIKVEEFVSRQMYPVLPYIFFPQNESVFKPSYKRLAADEIATFNENTFYNTDALQVYYQVLNIIGKRLRENPTAKITLVGCNDNTGPEANNLKLSRDRALNVREYLSGAWKIDTSRMRIEARNLPAKPTQSRDAEGVEENRRVEIVSDNWEIMKPSLVYDTVLVPSAPVIKFRMDAQASAGVAKATLRAFQGGRTLKKQEYLGQYEKEFSWNTAREQNTIPRTEEYMKFSFEAIDNDGNAAMPIDSVPVEQVTIRKKRSLRIKDKEIDTYRLILFDFDSPEVLSENKKIIQDIVVPNVKKTSVVQVTGFTDKLGSAEVNQRLSEGRAKSVATLVEPVASQTTAKGVGQKQLIYPNDTPEGRFLSRTVEVRVETPIED